TTQTPAEVGASLKVFRQLKAPSPPHPLVFTLDINEPQVHGIPASLVRSSLLHAAETCSGLVRFASEAPIGAHPVIVISNEKLVVDLAGLHGLTLHTPKQYPTELA